MPRLRPLTRDPRPPLSVSAPLYPGHLASACHRVLRTLDIKTGEKNKLKVGQMSASSSTLAWRARPDARLASPSMLRRRWLHLAARLRRDARSSLHICSQQRFLAARQKQPAENRKRKMCFVSFSVCFCLSVLASSRSQQGSVGNFSALTHEISACLTSNSTVADL